MLMEHQALLLVVDVQGKLARMMHDSDGLHGQLVTLIRGIGLFDIPTLWLEQLPDKLGATSEELACELRQRCQPIAKAHFSAWPNAEFRDALTLSGRRKVILCGIETHICVYQTCRDLLEAGFEVHLVADAVGSRTEANRQLGLAMMQQAGATLTNVESLLFELQHEASGERFKSLLQLIK
ncbi:hydrolase [Shewanella cyperi]|uniref:Hydrolase n=1 Tax=Shewanella cyperi TaxID=2814292 RepID=A0A974XLG9_9GAMM|nr:hydrolase [Shewanella cyperi]QSX29438.1 hydrolase [Shewanella cyperi]